MVEFAQGRELLKAGLHFLTDKSRKSITWEVNFPESKNWEPIGGQSQVLAGNLWKLCFRESVMEKCYSVQGIRGMVVFGCSIPAICFLWVRVKSKYLTAGSLTLIPNNPTVKRKGEGDVVRLYAEGYI